MAKRNPDLSTEESRALDRAEKLFDQANELDEDLDMVQAEIEDAITELKALEKIVKRKQAEATKLEQRIKALEQEGRRIAKAAGVEEWL